MEIDVMKSEVKLINADVDREFWPSIHLSEAILKLYRTSLSRLQDRA
jgi:hypothetical protein